MSPLVQVAIVFAIVELIILYCALLHDKYKYRCYACGHHFRKRNIIALPNTIYHKHRFLCRKCYGLDSND